MWLKAGRAWPFIKMATSSLVFDGREIEQENDEVEEQREEGEEEQSREVQDDIETVSSGKNDERLKRFRELHLRRVRTNLIV